MTESRTPWTLLTAVRGGALYALALLVACGCPSTPLEVPPARTPEEPAATLAGSGPDEAAGASLEPGAEVLATRVGEAHGLTYLEGVLGDADPEARLPLVIALHGLGGFPILPEPRYQGLSRAVRIVMPRAPTPFRGGFDWLGIRVGDRDVPRLANVLASQADVLAEFIAAIVATRPTMGRPIVTGFSQGGMLTFTLAVLHPEVVGQAFPLAGWLPPPLWPSARDGRDYPSIRAMHSRDDTVIPIEPTRQTIAALRDLGIAAELVEFDGVGHDMNDETNAAVRVWFDAAVTAILAADSASQDSARSAPAHGTTAAAP